VCVCVCVCACVRVHAWLRVSVYIYTCVHTYIYISVRVSRFITGRGCSSSKEVCIEQRLGSSELYSFSLGFDGACLRRLKLCLLIERYSLQASPRGRQGSRVSGLSSTSNTYEVNEKIAIRPSSLCFIYRANRTLMVMNWP